MLCVLLIGDVIAGLLLIDGMALVRSVAADSFVGALPAASLMLGSKKPGKGEGLQICLWMLVLMYP